MRDVPFPTEAAMPADPAMHHAECSAPKGGPCSCNEVEARIEHAESYLSDQWQEVADGLGSLPDVGERERAFERWVIQKLAVIMS